MVRLQTVGVDAGMYQIAQSQSSGTNYLILVDTYEMPGGHFLRFSGQIGLGNSNIGCALLGTSATPTVKG